MAKKVKWRNWGTLTQWEKWESGNPKGQPRKLFKDMNKLLKEKWIEVLTRSQLIDCYWLVFNSTEADLKDILKDKNTPVAYKNIIAEMSNKTTRTKAMQDYRDYMFWTAVKKEESRQVNKEWEDVMPQIIIQWSNENKDNINILE